MLLHPMHRGAFCQFSFHWIYYYGSNESNGKETGKMHLCAMQCFDLLDINKRNKTLEGHCTEQHNHQKVTNKTFWENHTFIGTLIKKSLWNVTCNSNEILDPKPWIQFWWIDIAPIWSAISNWYCCSNLKEI